MIQHKIISIRLTERDAQSLAMVLGYAAGAASRDNDLELRQHFMKLSDKVLVQLNQENYTYTAPRAAIVEALKREGIEIGN